MRSFGFSFYLAIELSHIRILPLYFCHLLMDLMHIEWNSNALWEKDFQMWDSNELNLSLIPHALCVSHRMTIWACTIHTFTTQLCTESKLKIKKWSLLHTHGMYFEGFSKDTHTFVGSFFIDCKNWFYLSRSKNFSAYPWYMFVYSTVSMYYAYLVIWFPYYNKVYIEFYVSIHTQWNKR